MDPVTGDERFSRQIMLPEVGPGGQERLGNTKVFILGAGGLASSAAFYLAAAGIGKIGIADDDRVDISNLNRQILHETSRIGMAKVDSARKSLRALYPALEIEAYPRRLTSPEQLKRALADYDLTIDCTDNFAARYHINEASLATGKPWFYGAVFGFEGQVMTFVPGNGPCYRCLYPAGPADPETATPVMGVAPGIIGILQAAEVMKHILGTGRLLVGRMLVVDLLEMSFAEFFVPQNAKCPLCRP